MTRKVNILTRAAVLLAIALVFQLVKMGQFVTGTGINAVLIIAASYCGLFWAMAIGCITPLMAVVLGVHPPAIIPLVPFIVAANIIYASAYWFIKNKNEYAGVLAAAAVKFLLLYGVVNYLITKVPAPIKLAMSTPQLVTAIAGGALGIIVLKFLRKENE